MSQFNTNQQLTSPNSGYFASTNHNRTHSNNNNNEPHRYDITRSIGQSKSELMKFLVLRANQTSSGVLAIPYYHDLFIKIYTERHTDPESKWYNMPVDVYSGSIVSNMKNDIFRFLHHQYDDLKVSPTYLVEESDRLKENKNDNSKHQTRKRKLPNTHAPNNRKKHKSSPFSNYNLANNNLSNNNLANTNTNDCNFNFNNNYSNNYSNNDQNNLNFNQNNNINNNINAFHVPPLPLSSQYPPIIKTCSKEENVLNKLIECAKNYDCSFYDKDKQAIHIYAMQLNNMKWITKREERELWLTIYNKNLNDGSILSYHGITLSKKKKKIKKETKRKTSPDKFVNIIVPTAHGFRINPVWMPYFDRIWAAMPAKEKKDINNALQEMKNNELFETNPHHAKKNTKRTAVDECKNNDKQCNQLRLLLASLKCKSKLDCCAIKEKINTIMNTDLCRKCHKTGEGRIDRNGDGLFYCYQCWFEYDEDSDSIVETDSESQSNSESDSQSDNQSET